MNTLRQNAKINTLNQPKHANQTLFSADTHISIGWQNHGPINYKCDQTKRVITKVHCT